MMRDREALIKFTEENWENEAVVQWLKENSDSHTVSKLVNVFDLLKKHIDEEENKNHSDDINITLLAHGSITVPMIPASCLLPQPNITDVLLYSPWNCANDVDVSYGVATGRIQPQHRVFYCKTKHGGQNPEEKHRPINLPNRWNSLKEAGDQVIPSIMLSPLTSPEDGVWKRFESLTKKHGPPGRNHITVPFILPGEGKDSVPFSLVTLALALVLISSRFKATVHLGFCLRDKSAGLRLNTEYLEHQYAYTVNNTRMTVSDDMFKMNTGPWFSSESVLLVGFFGTLALSLVLWSRSN